MSTRKNPNTQRALKNDLYQFSDFLRENQIFVLGDLGELFEQELEAYCTAFLDSKIIPHKITTTVSRKKGSLVSWLKWVHQQYPQIISFVPILNLERYKSSRSVGTTPSLSIAQWNSLMNEISSGSNTRLLTLCYSAMLMGGRRIGELLNLRWNDVDFQNLTITVRPLKHKEDISYYRVPFHQDLVRILKWYRESRWPIPEDDDLLFEVTQQNIDQSLKIYARRAGIKHLSAHVFRATFITWALERGDRMSEIMNSTLHQSVQMLRYYDRSNPIKNSSINKTRGLCSSIDQF